MTNGPMRIPNVYLHRRVGRSLRCVRTVQPKEKKTRRRLLGGPSSECEVMKMTAIDVGCPSSLFGHGKDDDDDDDDDSSRSR